MMRLIGTKLNNMLRDKLIGKDERDNDRPIVGKVTTDSWGRPL